MQLTRYTDYSLRVLVYLALREDDQLVTISEISDCFDIPRNHLVKIVHHLGKLKYIHTIRGRNGGIRIAQKPQEIILGRVIRDMESNLRLVNCGSPTCAIITVCKMRGILREAGKAFLNTLDQYTLSDLLADSDQIRCLLHVNRDKTSQQSECIPELLVID